MLEATQAYALREKKQQQQQEKIRGGTGKALYGVFGNVLLTYVTEDVLSPATAVAWAERTFDTHAAALWAEPRTRKFVEWVLAESSSSEEEDEESDDSDSEEEEEEDSE